MDRRTYLTTACGAALATVAGCIGDDEEPEIAEEDVGAEVSVTNNGYDPRVVTVSAGEAVKWTNETDNDRTVQAEETRDSSDVPSDPWEFSGQMVGVGQGEGRELSAYHMFEESGYYWFYDDIKTRFQMCGVVVVDEDESEVQDSNCQRIF